ncbi:MAG: hypothetical protein ABW092_07475 [Candidatus Thiodiazotropha sp.]
MLFNKLIVTFVIFFWWSSLSANDDLSRYLENSQKLAALVAEAAQKHDTDLLHNNTMNALVEALSDEKRFLQTKTYSKDNLGDLIQICSLSNQAVMSLVLFDLKSHIDPKADREKATTQTISLMQSNIRSFTNQLLYLQPFTIRCMAKQSKPMSDFVSSLTTEQMTPVRIQGLRKAQRGTAQLIIGGLQSSADATYDEAYRLAMAKALAESASELVSILPLKMRASIQSITSEHSKSIPATIKDYMNSLSEALDDRTCDGLCAI